MAPPSTHIFVTKMLEELEFSICSLRENRGRERLHDFLDGDRLTCQLVLCRTLPHIINTCPSPS